MRVNACAPVEQIPGEAGDPDCAIGIALSGGGYRAMLFHLGALWRLAECGLLSSRREDPRLGRISSVSGGSLTSAAMGMNWARLRVDEEGLSERFQELVVKPIRRMAGETVIGLFSGLWVLIRRRSINDYVTEKYSEHLFGAATLQDLPEDPRFIINATNLQSGALWRFSKACMADWKVGRINNPDIPLAKAVGASSAFPPFLSPARFNFSPDAYVPESGAMLQYPPFTTAPMLCDGGVYDNLGLETVYKRCSVVFASNGGSDAEPEPSVSAGWGAQSYRVFNLTDQQVVDLRKRQLIAAFEGGERKGAYWGIREDLAKFPARDKLPCPVERTARLAGIRTDLQAKDPIIQERLINWGYACSDAAIRSYFDNGLPPPDDFPYPASGVG